MSEKPGHRYGVPEQSASEVHAPDSALRRYTESPCGPLEALVMSLARDLHERERPGEDWFGLVGSSVSSFCRRACEAREIPWDWVRTAIATERLDGTTEAR